MIGFQRKTPRLGPSPVANAFGSEKPLITRTGTCTCSILSSWATYGAWNVSPPSSHGWTNASSNVIAMNTGAAGSHQRSPIRRTRARFIATASATQREMNSTPSASQFPSVAST